jgi:predicted MFS family arabinose efflux permease
MTILQRAAVLAPFQVRSFRYQWPADLLTSWAFEMETLILGWYVLVKSESVFLLAVFAALQYLGSLLGPLFGVAGDRIGHRTVLSALRGSFAVFAMVLMVLAFADALNPAVVLVIAFFNGLVRPSDMGVRGALVGASVPREHLMAAVGLSRMTSDSARVVGALTGAGLFAAFGMAKAYVVVVAFYLVGLLLTLQTQPMVRTDAEAARAAPTSPWRDLRDGLLYVWDEPQLRAAIWVAFLVNLVAFPVSMGLLPYVARSIYGLNETGLGYLAASFSFGALLGSIGLSVAGSAVRYARVMLIGTGAWFALLLIFAHLRSPVLGGVMLLLAGLAQSLSLVPLSVILLRTSDEAFRGRIMGVRMLAIYSLPIGLVVGGALVGRIGFPSTVTLYAVIGLTFTVLIAMRWRNCLWPRHAPANGG